MDYQSDEILRRLKASHEEVTNKVVNFIRDDPVFLNAISQGTGDATKVRFRFRRFREEVQKAAS
jgi:hypothetical protein